MQLLVQSFPVNLTGGRLSRLACESFRACARGLVRGMLGTCSCGALHVRDPVEQSNGAEFCMIHGHKQGISNEHMSQVRSIRLALQATFSKEAHIGGDRFDIDSKLELVRQIAQKLQQLFLL